VKGGDIAAGVLAAVAAVAAGAAVTWRADSVVAHRLASLADAGREGGAGTLRWAVRRVSSARWVQRFPLSDRAPGLLSAAGWSLTPAGFQAARLLAAGAGLAVAFPGAALVPAFALVAPIVALAAHRAPDFVLARAARRRRRLADAELPQFLDLLAAASTAGLGPHGALRRGACATSGPLREELDRFLDAVDLGARWRDQLADLAARIGLPDLRRAVHAMVRTERLGSSLAEALRELADDVREDRRSRATELARKAPVKMLFPLVFMVLPAFLLLTVVPVLVATLRSIR
jgi:tight adherence protein C